MNISSAQMRAIETNTGQKLIDALCLHLRTYHAAVLPRSDQQLAMKVKTGIVRARLRGLTLQPKIALYVALMFEIAPNFDDNVNIWRVLYRAGSVPDIQIDYLPALVREQDWAAAKAGAGPRAWLRVVGWA
ncbi:MAG TPA: hypothetical protein VKU01_35600 [Bryobacteraceae bacterium]|nr:hypothetical protein [Bryobacteraceae bacterium]